MDPSQTPQAHGNEEEIPIDPLLLGLSASTPGPTSQAGPSLQIQVPSTSTSTPQGLTDLEQQELSLNTSITISSPFIRDSPQPDVFNRSSIAQIISVAKRDNGINKDFTWSEHYVTLYHSLRDELFAELNRKLKTGLKPAQLLRDLDPTTQDPSHRTYIWFAKVGMQQQVDWMLCSEHLEIMQKVIGKGSEMGLETLDMLVRETGAWMVAGMSAADLEGDISSAGETDV